MSSEIFVYGYIEMPEGSEAQNGEVISRIGKEGQARGCSLLEGFSDIRKSWRSLTCSFAQIYKRTADEDCLRIQNQFEAILKKMKALSAHLTIEDLDEGKERYFDYSYGPVRFGGPDVWSRTRSRRRREVPEVLEG